MTPKLRKALQGGKMKDKIIEMIRDGHTHRQIRDALGVSLGQISKVRNEKNEPGIQEGEFESEIKTRKSIPKERDRLLKFHGYDPSLYDISSSRHSQWEQQAKGGEIITMFSSRITVKPKSVDESLSKDDIIEAIQSLKTKPLKGSDEVKERLSRPKLASIEIFDLHLGKLGWGEETSTDYDMKIAEKEFYDRVEYFASEIDGEVEKIIFVLGNDFFHYDNNKIETTAGTPQDTDTRPKKMFKKGLEIVCNAILRFSEIAPVEVPLVPGNHSANTIYFLAEAVSKAFEGNERVTIDTTPKTRKYIKYGQCLLGFAHGDDENKKELDGLMQKEVPELWGTTKHREFHLGHIHIETVSEVHGLKFRTVPSISGVDSWHYRKGYTQTERVAQMFIYDKERGLDKIYYR
jgi:hypothetical protein